MSLLNSIKQPLKMLRWRWRRGAAARRYGLDTLATSPIVIGNAMPKSGSHLLIQVLRGLINIGPFVDPGMPPLTRSADNENLHEAAVMANLRGLRSGDIAYAYLHAREPYIVELSKEGVASFFVYRDPRDVLVSHVFYASEIYPGHGMHAYYQRMKSVEERLNAAIEGVREPGFELSSIRSKYEKYLGWLEVPEVLAMRFEDLILKREEALDRIWDHLGRRGYAQTVGRKEGTRVLASGIAPRRSGTFRRGKPGEWKEHFTVENKRSFVKETGDLLQLLGYEKDTEW